MVKNFDSNAVWFITGCSTGLGQSFALKAYKSGHRVVATARKLESLSYLPDEDPRVLKLRLDVTSQENITSALDATVKQFGRLDVVINNAGYGGMADTEAFPEEKARDMVETMFWGPVRITKAAVPIMREVNKPGEGGTIVQVSSIGGYVAYAGNSFYHASKFALEGFSKSFAQEMLPEWNIKFLILSPGGVKTQFMDNLGVPKPEDRHPAYARPDAPLSQLLGYMLQPGLQDNFSDPGLCADVLFDAVTHQADRPLPTRLNLGPETVDLMRGEVARYSKELSEWEAESKRAAKPGNAGASDLGSYRS